MRWMMFVGCLGLAACGGDGLTESSVTDLPPGNGVGSAEGGDYDIEAITVACAGSCAPVNAFGLVISPCDIGARNEEVGFVTQADGTLRLDLEDVLWASRLEGGIWDDGSFEIGGVKTELGGQIRFISRATGTLVDGSWTGDLELRSVGSIEGQSRDCTANVEVTATRFADTL